MLAVPFCSGGPPFAPQQRQRGQSRCLWLPFLLLDWSLSPVLERVRLLSNHPRVRLLGLLVDRW